jgi:small subunit ribosomal protein S6
MPEAQARAKSFLREYETLFLVKPDLTDDVVDKIKDRVRGVVTRDGGKMIQFTVWGKKKLAYPLAKQNRAIYVHARYLGGTALVAEIERNLRIYEEVTRYISSRLADEVDPSTRETLEDVKLAGDVEERPAAPEREAAVAGFREEEVPEGTEEETPEEA